MLLSAFQAREFGIPLNNSQSQTLQESLYVKQDISLSAQMINKQYSSFIIQQQGFLNERSFQAFVKKQEQVAIQRRSLQDSPTFLKSMYTVNETTVSVSSQLSIVLYVQSNYPLVAPIALSISIPEEFDVVKGFQTCQLSYQVFTKKTQTSLQCQINQRTVTTTLQYDLIFDSYQQIVLSIDNLVRNPLIIGSSFPDISLQIQSKYSNLSLVSQSQQKVTSIQVPIQATMNATFQGDMINELLLEMITYVQVPSNSQTVIQFPNDWIKTESFQFGTPYINSSYKPGSQKNQLILKPDFTIQAEETIVYNISGISLPRHQLLEGVEKIKLIILDNNNREFQHGFGDISKDVQSRILTLAEANFQISQCQKQTPLIVFVRLADIALGSDLLEIFLDNAVSIDGNKLKCYQGNDTVESMVVTCYYVQQERKIVIKLDKVQLQSTEEQRFKIEGLTAPYSTKPSKYQIRLVDLFNREVASQQLDTTFQNGYLANFSVQLLSSSSIIGTYTNLTLRTQDDNLIYRNATVLIYVPTFLVSTISSFEVYYNNKKLQSQIVTINGIQYVKISGFSGFPLEMRNIKINKPIFKTESLQIYTYEDNALMYNISKNNNSIILGLNQCPSGYFDSDSMCNQCTSNCSQCSEKADQCLSCNPKSFFYQGDCLGSCPIGTVEDPINWKCQYCPSLCKKCDKSLACQECILGSFLKNGYCLDCKPENGYTYDYVNQTCIALTQSANNMDYYAIIFGVAAMPILLVICSIILAVIAYKLGANFKDRNYRKTCFFKSNYLSWQVVLGVIRIILQVCIVIMGGDRYNALLVVFYLCARLQLRLIYFYIVKGTNSVVINMFALFVKVQVVELYYYQDLRSFLLGRKSINELETLQSKIMQAVYLVIDAAIVNAGFFLITPDPKITAHYCLLIVDCYLVILGSLGLKPIILIINDKLCKNKKLVIRRSDNVAEDGSFEENKDNNLEKDAFGQPNYKRKSLVSRLSKRLSVYNEKKSMNTK
eukprot:403369432